MGWQGNKEPDTPNHLIMLRGGIHQPLSMMRWFSVSGSLLCPDRVHRVLAWSAEAARCPLLLKCAPAHGLHGRHACRSSTQADCSHAPPFSHAHTCLLADAPGRGGRGGSAAGCGGSRHCQHGPGGRRRRQRRWRRQQPQQASGCCCRQGDCSCCCCKGGRQPRGHAPQPAAAQGPGLLRGGLGVGALV